MNAKTYVATVMVGDGSKLMDARGRKGLKALLKNVGLSGKLTGGKLYAENGVAAQVHLEWLEKSEWEGTQLFRERKFK